MKKRLSTIILAAVFLTGLALLLYPTVSDAVNARHQSSAIAKYEENVSSLAETDYSDYRAAAYAYNEGLAADSDCLVMTDADKAEYNSLLDPTGNGIMGYLEISAIGVKLPIYHGTDDTVLQVGIGHLEGTSLPVGGRSTHSVLSGHRGLPSAKLLTDLDRLTEGDIFLLHILDEVLAYQVDQISIVEPTDCENLKIVDGMDYCTLVTCTPYGVNSHRLLVRGVRVAYDEKAAQVMNVMADATELDTTLVASVLAVPILIVLFIWLLTSTGKKRPRGGKGGENQ